jgi:hypothetical protein
MRIISLEIVNYRMAHQIYLKFLRSLIPVDTGIFFSLRHAYIKL